jgi:hypothetical protein
MVATAAMGEQRVAVVVEADFPETAVTGVPVVVEAVVVQRTEQTRAAQLAVLGPAEAGMAETMLLPALQEAQTVAEAVVVRAKMVATVALSVAQVEVEELVSDGPEDTVAEVPAPVLEEQQVGLPDSVAALGVPVELPALAGVLSAALYLCVREGLLP